MRSRWRRFLCCLFLLVLAGSAGMPVAGAQDVEVDLYSVDLDDAELREVAAAGYDIASLDRQPDGRWRVQLVLSAAARDGLGRRGFTVSPWRSPDGATLSEVAARQQQDGYQVWRPFDGAGGLREELYALADANPGLVALRVLGSSVRGQEILAARVTKDVSAVPDGARPAVLYLAGQHAREWISTEFVRLLLHHFVSQYGRDAEITDFVDTRELWFVLVANPDGYDYSFTDGNRMWRRNLRDNDGDGRLTQVDGVDLNRNCAAHWGIDNEGSNGDPADDTYRGPAPASEPETMAYQGLIDRVPFAFVINYHSAANLLLYPHGWQEHTDAADRWVFETYAGTEGRPAIPSYSPMPVWELYPTNGESCDYAYSVGGALCFVPEMSDGGSGQGFVFPDDPELVQDEFELNLPFALDVARSALDPGRPQSHLGSALVPFYEEPFALSYGAPQTVEVLAARELGDITLHWRIGDGPEQSAPAYHWPGGRRYGFDDDVYYHRVRGPVSGARPGDEVTVWFSAATARSDEFRYTQVSDTGAPVLVLAAEDYTGARPEYAVKDKPAYLQRYLDALAEIGLPADVYDIDARGRSAPSALGVLSHYDAVIWYTGDDLTTTTSPDQPVRASGLPLQTMLAARDYLNEGGKLVFSGAAAVQHYNGTQYIVDPDLPCEGRNCGMLRDDFFQYYLGGYNHLFRAGGQTWPVSARGTAAPLDGLAWRLDHPLSITDTVAYGYAPTGRYLPEETHPLYRSWIAAAYDRPDLAPHTGEYSVHGEWSWFGWERLTRTIDLTHVEDGELRFWVSHNLIPNADWLFVEAHTLGQDDWTTLPDSAGHTTSDLGLYCTYRIQDFFHPHLARYMSVDRSSGEAVCVPRGTSGSWHAATGDSGSWQEWRIDLSAYAGGVIEVAVSHLAVNRATLGVYLDDVSVTVGGVTDTTSFEDGLGGWVSTGPPAGCYDGGARFQRRHGSHVSVGAAVATADSVLFGFELGHVAALEDRVAILDATLRHLGVAAGWRPTEVIYVPLVMRDFG